MKVISLYFQTLGRAFEPLRENQKPRRQFENSGRMFEKPLVFVLTWLMLSQSAKVNNSVNHFIKMREIGKLEDRAIISFQMAAKVK